MNDDCSTPSSLYRPLMIACSMCIIAGAAALGSWMEIIDSPIIPKFIGVSFGVVLIVTANYFPKRIYPACSPQVKRRIAWLFAISGLLYIIVWITGDSQRTGLLPALMFAPACIISMLIYRYTHLTQPTSCMTETPS